MPPRNLRPYGQYLGTGLSSDYPLYAPSYVYTGIPSEAAKSPEPFSELTCQRSVQLMPVPTAHGGTRTIKITRC
jgi:hypothetical protein